MTDEHGDLIVNFSKVVSKMLNEYRITHDTAQRGKVLMALIATCALHLDLAEKEWAGYLEPVFGIVVKEVKDNYVVSKCNNCGQEGISLRPYDKLKFCSPKCCSEYIAFVKDLSEEEKNNIKRIYGIKE